MSEENGNDFIMKENATDVEGNKLNIENIGNDPIEHPEVRSVLFEKQPSRLSAMSNFQSLKESVKDMLSKNPKDPNFKKPFINTLILGVCFFFLRSSFLTPSNLTAQLFDENGYKYLGEIEILLIYGCYGVSSLFYPSLLRWANLNLCLVISGFGFPSFLLGAFYAIECKGVESTGCNYYLVYIINLLAACICGCFMGLLWMVQTEYVTSTAPAEKIGLFMGVFYAFAQAAQALSTVLSLVLILNLKSNWYYMTLFGIGIFFMLCLNFVPKAQRKNKSNQNSLLFKETKVPTLKEDLIRTFALLKLKRMRALTVFFMSTGMVIAFYSAFLYKIIKISKIPEENLSEDDFKKEQIKNSSYVFLLLGFSEFFGGIIVSYVADHFPKYLCALFAQLLVEISLISTMMAFNLESYPWCFVAAFFWGISDCFIRSLSNVLTKIECPKDGLAGFGLYRFMTGVGSVIVVVLSLALNDYKNAFMIIIFAFQIVGVMSIGYLMNDEKKK